MIKPWFLTSKHFLSKNESDEISQWKQQRRGYYNTNYIHACQLFQEEFKTGAEGGLEAENSGWGIRKGFTEEVVFTLSFERWWEMQSSSDRGKLLKQRHNARKTRGVLGADKIDLSEAGGHSHKSGVEGTNTQSQTGSFMRCIKSLGSVSTRWTCNATSRNLCSENNQRAEQRFMSKDVYSSIFIVKNGKQS